MFWTCYESSTRYQEQQEKKKKKKRKHMISRGDSVFIYNATGEGEICILQDWMPRSQGRTQGKLSISDLHKNLELIDK